MENPSRRQILKTLSGVSVAGIAAGTTAQVTGVYDFVGSDACPDGLAPDWQYEIGMPSAPVVGDSVFVSSYSYYRWSLETRSPGRLYSLDRQTGEIRWQFESEKFGLDTPTVAERQVYVGSAAGNVTALDQRSGELLWQQQVIDANRDDVFVSSPIYLDGQVLAIAGSDSEIPGKIVSMLTETGEVQWVANLTKEPGDIVGFEDSVLVSTFDQSTNRTWIHRIDAADGHTVWEIDLYGDLDFIVSNNVLAATTIGYYDEDRAREVVFALDTESGDVRWSKSVPGDRGDKFSALAATEELVLLGTEQGYMYAFDNQSGRLEWKTSLTTADVVEPEKTFLAINEIHATETDIYIIDDRSKLFVVSSEDGTVRSEVYLTEPDHLSGNEDIRCIGPHIEELTTDGDEIYTSSLKDVYRFPIADI